MLIPFNKCIELYGKPFQAVVHIGADVGQECVDYFNAGVKQVVWFEANKTTMKDLYQNTMQYDLKQFYYCECLFDVDNDEVTFNITNNDQSSSILPLGTHEKHHPHVKVIEQRKLRTKRFDTFYKNQNQFDLSNFDFINLDVQGAELRVLKGFGNIFDKFQNIKGVFCEINIEELYVGAGLENEVNDYLKQFEFVQTIKHLTPYNWGDALYLRK